MTLDTHHWVISKDFNFDYSHRVHVQRLRTNFCAAGDGATKCRFQHGHTGLVTIFVEGSELNPQHMLCDFKELGFAKDFIDEHIDHKFIIDIQDPLFKRIVRANIDTTNMVATLENKTTLPLLQITMPETDHVAGYKIDTTTLDELDKEFYGSYFIVDFCPTSERLAAWVFDWVDAKMSLIGVKAHKVIWKETPKTQAVYTRN